MLLEMSGEITPEWMKRQSQSKNKTELWMWLMTEARSNAVKSNTAYEPGMLGPWIKASWKWSNRRSKSECWPSQFSSVQTLSHVWLFATAWIEAPQASLSITNSLSSLRFTSIESVMWSSHFILCRPLFSCPQTLKASKSFPMSQQFAWGGQSTGVSALASFLPKNTQDWSPLGWTGWISLQMSTNYKCWTRCGERGLPTLLMGM